MNSLVMVDNVLELRSPDNYRDPLLGSFGIAYDFDNTCEGIPPAKDRTFREKFEKVFENLLKGKNITINHNERLRAFFPYMDLFSPENQEVLTALGEFVGCFKNKDLTQELSKRFLERRRNLSDSREAHNNGIFINGEYGVFLFTQNVSSYRTPPHGSNFLKLPKNSTSDLFSRDFLHGYSGLPKIFTEVEVPGKFSFCDLELEFGRSLIKKFEPQDMMTLRKLFLEVGEIHDQGFSLSDHTAVMVNIGKKNIEEMIRNRDTSGIYRGIFPLDRFGLDGVGSIEFIYKQTNSFPETFEEVAVILPANVQIDSMLDLLKIEYGVSK